MKRNPPLTEGIYSMPKKRKKKDKRNSQKQKTSRDIVRHGKFQGNNLPQKSEPSSRFKKALLKLGTLSLAWKIFIALITLFVILSLSLPSIYYYSTSPITVNLGEIVDTSDPFSALFEVNNEGYVPIKNIKVSYWVRDANTDVGNVLEDVAVEREGYDIAHIEAHDQVTINWAPLIKSHEIRTADIEISVTYSFERQWWSSLLFGSRTEHFRFITVTKPDGELIWTKRSVSE